MASERSPARKILIVDDEPELVRLLTLRLTLAGYDTRSAADGQAATEMALSYQPDLVLLDIGLPIQDGYQVAAILRAAERTSHIPIVFLTARTWDLEKARQVGPDGYLVKPYKPADLLEIVGRLTAKNDPTLLAS